MKSRQGPAVTLSDILAGKERKAQVQEALRRCHQSTVIGIGINMPGPVKYSDDTLDLVLHALARLRHQLRECACQLIEERLSHAPTGPVACLAVDGDAEMIKKIAVAIESEGDYGRLLDIDVYRADGRPLSRDELGLPSRRCLVCDEKAAICIRAARHKPEEVLLAAKRILENFRATRRAAPPGFARPL